MNSFAHALAEALNRSETTNGAGAFVGTTDNCVDLFFNIGSARNDIPGAVAKFAGALAENPVLARKILFWARDVRGGAGEREVFRSILKYLEQTDKNTLIGLLPLVPEYGRWDDLLVFEHTSVVTSAFGIIASGLKNPATQGLCAKWMPRKGLQAKQLRDFLRLNPKAYRKLLVGLTKVVETKMCANEWETIEFPPIPSVAQARYARAFARHTPETYANFIKQVESGEVKINANAVFPHDVLKTFAMGQPDTGVVQWNALPNYLGDDFILPLVDVSGSMTCRAGGSSNTTCMDVAVALGLYLATKQTGAFAGMFMTFTDEPQLQKLTGSLPEMIEQLQSADWGGSTNVEAAFRRILQVAVNGKVSQAEMPKYLLILSDMQFNQATDSSGGWNSTSEYSYTVTGHEMLKRMFTQAGYEMPKIVYWNLNGSYGNYPIEAHETGAALVSGFSPAILKSILAAKSFTPYDVMMDTLNLPRYAKV